MFVIFVVRLDISLILSGSDWSWRLIWGCTETKWNILISGMISPHYRNEVMWWGRSIRPHFLFISLFFLAVMKSFSIPFSHTKQDTLSWYMWRKKSVSRLITSRNFPPPKFTRSTSNKTLVSVGRCGWRGPGGLERSSLSSSLLLSVQITLLNCS